MTTTNKILSPAEQQHADQIDAHIQRIEKLKDACHGYKLGDVYIIEYTDTKYVEQNSMGEPLKYQVVYISPLGIPYLQRICAKGNTKDTLHLPPEIEYLENMYLRVQPVDWHFVQDPAQLDAIILQQDYVPMKEHNEKLRLSAEINKHNKSILVPTGHYNAAGFMAFLKNLKVGDKFWTGVDTQYVVHVPATKHKSQWYMTVIDMNQQEVELALADFAHKRLYKAQPRSFTKEVKK